MGRPKQVRGERNPTGLTDVDELTMGWQVSEATVIAARPSMGKSSLGMQTAIHAAEQGHPVLVFALEMSGEETTIRSLASESRVNSKWLKTGMLPNGELYRDQQDNRTFGRTDHAR